MLWRFSECDRLTMIQAETTFKLRQLHPSDQCLLSQVVNVVDQSLRGRRSPNRCQNFDASLPFIYCCKDFLDFSFDYYYVVKITIVILTNSQIRFLERGSATVWMNWKFEGAAAAKIF